MFAQNAMSAAWSRLHIPGKELVEARLQCHHAVQINTRLARGFVPAQADDSHTSLSGTAAAAHSPVNWPVRSGWDCGLRI